MVCKEEICNWFRHNPSYERLDLLCKLLHLCSSHEIRFIASIVEDQARKDFSALRDSAFKANDASELRKLSPDLFRPTDRSNLLVYLSLLNSTNTACAHVLFTMLTRVESQRLECHLHGTQTIPGKESPGAVFGRMDADTADDVILLYTMAAYHPAFTITQRLQLSDYLQKAQASLAGYLTKPTIPEYSQDVHTSTSSSSNSSSKATSCMNQLNKCLSQNSCQSQNSAIKKAVFVKKIEYKDFHWDAYRQCHVIHLKVTVSNDEVKDIQRTCLQLSDFSAKLCDLFPADLGAEHLIPYLSQGQEGSTLLTEEHISKYIRELSELPDHILHCDYIREFFDGDQLICEQSVCGQISDVYNSQLATSCQDTTTTIMFSGQVATSNDECLDLCQCLSVPTAHATTTVVQQRISYSSVVVSPLPHHSPLSSPLTSPHISPSQHTSPVNDQATKKDVIAWLKNARLYKYPCLSGYSWQELSQLDDQDLEKLGLTESAKRKFRKELEAQLQKVGAVVCRNGVVRPLRARNDSPQSPSSTHSQSSAQSGSTPALSPTPSSVCDGHAQVHLPLTIVTKVGSCPTVMNGMNSTNSLGSCSGLSDCSVITPPSSPQSQGNNSQQMVVTPGGSQKQYPTENGEDNEENTISSEGVFSPTHQGGVPNVAEVHPFAKSAPVTEALVPSGYPSTPDGTAETSSLPLSNQRMPPVMPIRMAPPSDKGMPLAVSPFGMRPRSHISAPHIRSPRLPNSGNHFVAPMMPIPPGLPDPPPHSLLITKPGSTQPSQISPEVGAGINNLTGDNKPVNYSVMPTPHQGLIPCIPSAMGPAPGCHVVQRPTALAIPNTNCITYNSVTTPTIVTTVLDKPSPIILQPTNMPPPTSDINVPYANTASCSVTFTTRTAFTPTAPSPGSNQSGSSLLSTPPSSSLTPQPPANGNNNNSAATGSSSTSVATSPSAGLVHPASSTQTPTTVPTPIPQTLSLTHSTVTQSECSCTSCHSPQPLQPSQQQQQQQQQHPIPLQTIPNTMPFNYHLQQQHQQQQSLGWQGAVFPGSYTLHGGFVPVSSNGLINPSISFPLFTPHLAQSPFTNLPPEVLVEGRNYHSLFQAANQSLPHTFQAQLHYPVLPGYATGIHLPSHNNKPKSLMCYNCGNHGHMAADCEAPTIDSISRVKFSLKMQPRTETD